MIIEKISFVFVNYFSSELIISNLLRIERMKLISPHVEFNSIIVNNSLEKFDFHETDIFHNVNILYPNSNLGYAKGNNLGIKQAESDSSSHIVICNPDIILHDSFVNELKKDLTVYSKLNNYHLSAAFAVRIKGLTPYYNKPSFLGVILPAITRYKDFKVESYMDYKSIYRFHGACFVIPVSNVKGFSDYFYPDTFLYIEEDLFAFKAESSKLKIFNLPSVEVVHIGGASTNKSIPWKKYTYYFSGLNLLFNKRYNLPRFLCFPLSFTSVFFRFVLEQRSRFSWK
ncbi:glycosyltransferase family 2 protein [Shewanella sp. SG44-2]|uniref:glycosyltransferase family 2 protein n=1 Tax=Shewanella sp. SG44-2 TaxID=2760962 RepID=UPI001600B2C9|nr:glycosyltransferase family 2 protein [Shewanella sp. SG44-2]MBB1428478.1 glycosyltransferase family 2 protein [Shewanella sp. SG44-2]